MKELLAIKIEYVKVKRDMNKWYKLIQKCENKLRGMYSDRDCTMLESKEREFIDDTINAHEKSLSYFRFKYDQCLIKMTNMQL